MAKKPNPMRDYEMTLTGGYPLNKWIIINKDGQPEICMFIMDVEYDPVKIVYCGIDDTFTVEVPEYSYLMLSQANIADIYFSIPQAEALYDKIEGKFNDEVEEYRGWKRYCCKPKLPANAAHMRHIAENFAGSPVIEGMA